MKKSKISLLLIMLSLFFVISSSSILAEVRNIYVGDLIELKIQGEDLTLDELKDKFKDFEIVNVSDISNGYLLTIRSFEPGEKIIMLGDKEIKIVVKSILNEIEREEVYEGDLNPQEAGFYLQWKYVLFALFGIFLITIGANLWLFFRKKKAASLKPYQRFIKELSDLSLEQNDYLVRLTICFKEYLESTYKFHIRGKTSTEIINEISHIPNLCEKLPAIKSWLQENDYYKFSGTNAPLPKKMELTGNLQELVGSIEQTKEVEIR